MTSLSTLCKNKAKKQRPLALPYYLRYLLYQLFQVVLPRKSLNRLPA